MNSILYSALQSHGIPFPKEDVASNKFTRWGKVVAPQAITNVTLTSACTASTEAENGSNVTLAEKNEGRKKV